MKVGPDPGEDEAPIPTTNGQSSAVKRAADMDQHDTTGRLIPVLG